MYDLPEWGYYVQLVRYSDIKTALGGPATLSVVGQFDEATAQQLFSSLWREIFFFEKKFSRFLPSSELSKFNKKAGVKTPISPAMKDVLVTAKRFAEETKDLYNPFILPALQRAGYKNSALKGYANDPVPDYTDRQVVASEELEIGEDWALIPHGSAIDLGGMGKGYLLDQVATTIDAHDDIAGYWLELSGDIITSGHDENGDPVRVGIQNALDISHRHDDYQVVGDGGKLGVATSGTFRRGAHKSNEITHHIIDPRTGKAASTDVLLATICAETAVAADIYASCVVIVGSDQGKDFATNHAVDSWMIQYKADEYIYAIGGKHIEGVVRA